LIKFAVKTYVIKIKIYVFYCTRVRAAYARRADVRTLETFFAGTRTHPHTLAVNIQYNIHIYCILNTYNIIVMY